MTVYGYIRVGTETEYTQNQKKAILLYAHKHALQIDHWIQRKTNSGRIAKKNKIDELLLKILKSGDTLIVSELSRLGRSVGHITIIVDQLFKQKIRVVFLKEELELSRKKFFQQETIISMFSLLANIERGLISERTKEGLKRAKADGKLLGRPKGPGKSKLDGKEEEIRTYLQKKVSKASIAKIFEVSWPCIDNFIKTRGL